MKDRWIELAERTEGLDEGDRGELRAFLDTGLAKRWLGLLSRQEREMSKALLNMDLSTPEGQAKASAHQNRARGVTAALDILLGAAFEESKHGS